MDSKAIFLIAVLLFAFVNADCSSSSSGDSTIYPNYYTTTETGGQATYYGAYTGGGACTLDPTPPEGTASSIFSTVAIADNVWANSKACGMCINMTATGSGSGSSSLGTKSYLVFVNNECPSCVNNGIDIGLSGDGAWGITWKAVPCPVGSTNIQFWMQGSNQYYIKLQARNTRYPVYGIAVLQNGVYNALVRTADNFFTAGSSVTFPLVFPLTVKVTAANGDSVVDSVPSLTNGVVMNGATQFLDCSSSSSSTTATVATSTTAKLTTTTTAATTTTAKPTTATTAATTAASSTSVKATTTTGVASTTGSQNSLYVYKDSVLSPFSDYTWASKTVCDTSTSEEGNCSYSFSPSSYQAAYFFANTEFSTTTYSNVEFYIKTTADAAASQIWFALVKSGAEENQQKISTYATVPANTWTKVTVPLLDFPSNSYDGMWFQDNTGKTNPNVHLDAIRLY